MHARGRGLKHSDIIKHFRLRSRNGSTGEHRRKTIWRGYIMMISAICNNSLKKWERINLKETEKWSIMYYSLFYIQYSLFLFREILIYWYFFFIPRRVRKENKQLYWFRVGIKFNLQWVIHTQGGFFLTRVNLFRTCAVYLEHENRIIDLKLKQKIIIN